ncbi:MAG: riboflavin synthase [Rikenellaceae bacterium]|nr:riboflavin synthase [Rikenellaceae bacterium]MDE7355658.1 riboflavin synthase [Rikenellaceae bacterium]
MFSGIIESVGTVTALRREGGNLHITLSCPFADELKIDQSVAHNGVCLTVVELSDGGYTVTAIDETLKKSNLGLLAVGDKVNLERSMRPDALLDGHIVQGHVDMTARCTDVQQADGSHVYTFGYEPGEGRITVEKGSVAVNGVSLTVVNSRPDGFQVAIIPYTWEHTNFHTFAPGTVVNIEFDIIGKYISKLMQNYR